MAPFLTAVLLFSMPGVPPADACSCDRAYDAVQTVARSEPGWGYAREVLVEGRKTFVHDCRKHLKANALRCLVHAHSSVELYDCT